MTQIRLKSVVKSTSSKYTHFLNMKLIFRAIIALSFLFSIVLGVKYKMIYKGDEFCPDPDPPYEETRKVDVKLSVVNNSDNFYYNADIRVKENLSGYVWRYKKGIEKDGKITYESDFKGLSCKSFIFKLIYGMSNIKYDHKTCDIFKGNYSFHKLEVTKIDRAQVFLPTRELGTNVYVLTYYKPTGTCFCLQSRVLYVKI